MTNDRMRAELTDALVNLLGTLKLILEDDEVMDILNQRVLDADVTLGACVIGSLTEWNDFAHKWHFDI